MAVHKTVVHTPSSSGWSRGEEQALDPGLQLVEMLLVEVDTAPAESDPAVPSRFLGQRGRAAAAMPDMTRNIAVSS